MGAPTLPAAPEEVAETAESREPPELAAEETEWGTVGSVWEAAGRGVTEPRFRQTTCIASPANLTTSPPWRETPSIRRER